MSGGGGGSSYDAAYNARVADLMEQQQGWTAEDRAWSLEYERPFQEAMMSANLEMLPQVTGLQKARLNYAESALPEIYGGLGKHDVGGAMNTATADVAMGFNSMGKERDMRMKGLGVLPTSSAFQTTGLDMSKALGIASARNKARTDTTALNLNEKMMGLQI